jgi:hypothetical protein
MSGVAVFLRSSSNCWEGVRDIREKGKMRISDEESK